MAAGQESGESSMWPFDLSGEFRKWARKLQQEVQIVKGIIFLFSREFPRPNYKTIRVKVGPKILLNARSLLTPYKL